MTSRSWGVIFLKLIGLYYALEAALGVLQMAGQVLGPPIEGMPSPRVLAALSLSWVLLAAAFAAMCLFLTDPLADWLFGEGVPERGTSTPTEIVRAGLVLMGIYQVVVHVTPVVWFVGETLWMLEGSRQGLFHGYLGQTRRDFVSSAGPLIVGVFLCVRNQKIAEFVWNLPRERVEPVGE